MGYEMRMTRMHFRLEYIRTNTIAIKDWAQILYAIPFIRHGTGQGKNLIITWTAGFWLYIITSASLTATVPMRAAGPFVTMMLGMNIFTVKPLNESNYKTLSAAAAGMYIESYDTHRVPDYKQ